MFILLMCLYALFNSGELTNKLQNFMEQFTGGSEEYEADKEPPVAFPHSSIEVSSEEEHKRKKRKAEIPKQPITKHVTECPAVGYFFKREFVEENKVCYLCFCKEDDMAICFPRENKRCDAESFHFHGIGKREQRLRRSPGLTNIFSRDSARDLLHKQSSETCKPHEGSKSEGCPPVDWCTGCTVCDCNSKGQWDCHILSFCADDEKLAMQKKREAIKNFGKRRKTKNAPKKEPEKIFRSTKQIYTANGKKNSVKSNKVQTKNFQQASKKNSNLNMKKKLAPQRRSPQIIKKSQNQNKKMDNRYLSLSTGKSRQKKMVVSPKKNNSQKAKVVKSTLVRNSSKKVQVRRTPSQNPRKVVKPNRKTVHSRPPVKPHRKSQTKSQPSKRSLIARRNQKKDPKQSNRVNTTQPLSTNATPLFNTLKEQLQEELNKKILEVVEKISKHSVPLKTKNKKKVKRSAELGKRRPKRMSDQEWDIRTHFLIAAFNISGSKDKTIFPKIYNIALDLLKKEDIKRHEWAVIMKSLNVSVPNIKRTNSETENKTTETFVIKQETVNKDTVRKQETQDILNQGNTTLDIDKTKEENKTREKRSATFMKLKESQPSRLHGGDEYKNSISKHLTNSFEMNTQNLKKLKLIRAKRNNRSRDLDSIISAIGMIDVENASLPVHTLSTTKYLITTKPQRYPLDDVNKKNASVNIKNFKRSVSDTKHDEDLTILKLNNQTENLFGGQKYIVKSLDSNKSESDIPEMVNNPTTKAVSSTYYEFLRKKGDFENSVHASKFRKYIDHNNTVQNTKNNETITLNNKQDSELNDTIEKENFKKKALKTTLNIRHNINANGTNESPVTTTEKERRTSFSEQIPTFTYFYVPDSRKVNFANTTLASTKTSTVKDEVTISIIDVPKHKNSYKITDLYASKVKTTPLVESTTIKEDKSTMKLFKNLLLYPNVKSDNWSYTVIGDKDGLNIPKDTKKSKPTHLIEQSTETYLISKKSTLFNNVTNLDHNKAEKELVVKPLTSITAQIQPQTKKLENHLDTLTISDTILKYKLNSTENTREYINNDETMRHNIKVEEFLNRASKITPTMPKKTEIFHKQTTESSAMFKANNIIDLLKETTPNVSYVTIGDKIIIIKENNGEKGIQNYTKAAYTLDVGTKLPDLNSNSYNIPPIPGVFLSFDNLNKEMNNTTQNSSVNISETNINEIDIKRHNYEIISDIHENVTSLRKENINFANNFDALEITQNSINNNMDDKASKIREQRFSTIHDFNTTTDKSVSKVLFQYFTPKVPFRRRYDIKKIHSSSKKHKLTKIVSTLYNKPWKDEKFQIQPIQLSQNQTNKTDSKSKMHDLKNFFYKIVNNLARRGNNERKNAKARKFKVVKYLQKFFKKIFSNGNKKTNPLAPKLNKKNILKSLCTTFGPCDINNENKAKLHQMIDLLNKETYGMLKTIKVIKGLLRVVDFGNNETNNTYKTRKMKFKSDVQKLHNILQNFYNDNPSLNNLSEKQRVQVSQIKNSTQDFVQSAARFTMILNNIIYLVTPKNTTLLHGIEQKKNVDLKRELDHRQRTSDKSSLVKKLRELISKYSLMQYTFMRKMMKVLSTVENKSVAKRTIETPKSGNNNETFQEYLRNVINSIKKLKTLADTESHGRHKRELKDDDSVEYLLMLMEYLLKQNRPEIAPVNDGIDLLIEAIKSAPDIKPMEKNIVTYPVNQSRFKMTTTPYVTTTTSTPIKPKSVTMKILINSDSASDNSLPENMQLNNSSMKNEEFKLNYVEDDYDSPYANLAKNYKYQSGYYPEEEKQKRRLNVQHKYRKPQIQDIENDVEKLEYGTEITLNKNLDEVIQKFPYESPFQKLKDNVEKLSVNPPVQDLKSDVAKLEANLQVLQKDFQSLQSYPVEQEVTPAVKVELFEEDRPVIGINEVSTTTAPVTTEIQLDVVIPVTEVLPVQNNASCCGGDEERAESFMTEVEDEVLSPGFQFSKASTSPPIDSTITLDPVSIKVLNNNEDVSMSLSKSKLNWIDEAYMDDNKADLSTELRSVIKSVVNQSTEKSPSYAVENLGENDIMTTESPKEVKKNVGLSKEIQRDQVTGKSGITEEVLRRKNIDLLNSLDYGTEKGETDVSGSKEGNTEDKYSGDTFSWYFDK